MFHLGRFPTESSGHVSEYLPYFRSQSDNLNKYTRPEYRGESGFYANAWPKWRAENDLKLQKVLLGEETWSVVRGAEYASRIVEAMFTGEPTTIYVNIPNRGLIDNLPDGVVEVASTVDATGIHPRPFGSLPPQLASWVRRHMEFHDLTVTAVLEEDREAAVHALMLDPLTSAVCAPAEIREIFDEMVEAERDHLPAFLIR
jgi:alpha-galactosidase